MLSLLKDVFMRCYTYEKRKYIYIVQEKKHLDCKLSQKKKLPNVIFLSFQTTAYNYIVISNELYLTKTDQ